MILYLVLMFIAAIICVSVLGRLVLYSPNDAVVLAAELGSKHDLTVSLFKNRRGWTAYYHTGNFEVVCSANNRPSPLIALREIILSLESGMEYR